MSITVIVSLQVADFDDWKAVYDARENDRVEAGIHAKTYRNVDDPNNAYSIGTAPSKEAFIAFAQQPAIQEAMKNAGVLAPPEINFLEEA